LNYFTTTCRFYDVRMKFVFLILKLAYYTPVQGGKKDFFFKSNIVDYKYVSVISCNWDIFVLMLY